MFTCNWATTEISRAITDISMRMNTTDDITDGYSFCRQSCISDLCTACIM